MKKGKNNTTSKKIITRAKPETPQPALPPYVICVGASAGGLNAIAQLFSQIPATINASVFVVLHLSRSALGNVFIERIKRDTDLPCKLAENNENIQTGYIYLAPPDAHLLVKKGKIILGHGPDENRFRPSIDVLFRSASTAYGERAIGVILTGLLNDGTNGMWAIHESGGKCIVQDPNEAEYPDMVLSVIDRMEVNYVANLEKIGGILQSLTQQPPGKKINAPDIIKAESELSEKMATGINQVGQIGDHTVFSCPDCGGGLWKIKNGHIDHFRCHIGHSFTTSDLVIKQAESIEQTLWVAVRMMEERKLMLSRMARENKDKGLERIATDFSERSEQLEHHITNLKELLFSVNKE
jgi:two-component system, chemotaxis family, protein-glutamate methylesterase/glutaminase